MSTKIGSRKAENGATQKIFGRKSTVFYYEGYSECASVSLLPFMTKVLNVSAPELLEIKPLMKNRQTGSRLPRRLQPVPKLGPQF